MAQPAALPVSQKELEELIADAKPGDTVYGAFGYEGALVSIDRANGTIEVTPDPWAPRV